MNWMKKNYEVKNTIHTHINQPYQHSQYTPNINLTDAKKKWKISELDGVNEW